MRVAVNAVTSRDAGGRAVVRNFLRAVSASGSTDRYDVFVPADAGFEDLGSQNIRIRPLPKRLSTSRAFPLVQRLWLPKRLAELRPDVVFTMGNIAVPTRIPQLVLFAWPYALYPESEVWKRLAFSEWLKRRVRLRFLQRSLRYATLVAVQTETARERFARLYPGTPLIVVPNAVSLPEHSSNMRGTVEGRGKKRLLCLTRYYDHKNLEILLEVASLAKSRGLPLQILLTIAASQAPGAAALLERIRAASLDEYLHNLGPVPMAEVPSLYASVDGLLLPTLLESFSGTYVEAMHYGVPVFTSDRDFARDVCGNAAVLFDPHDPHAILDGIVRTLDDEARVNALRKLGRERVRAMPTWPQVCAQILEELAKLAAHPKAAKRS